MSEPETIRKNLLALIENFGSELKKKDLRRKVLALIPVFRQLRELGKSLIVKEDAVASRDRILYYFRKYPFTVINGDELLVVSAIQDYPRRLRELRVQFGWAIVNGITAKEMFEENDIVLKNVDISIMKPDDYILLSANQDKEAAFRWNMANDIRRCKDAVRAKVLEYLKANVGKAVTGEELRYVANDKTEWARRVRELRTELGWPIITKNTGRPDLSVGSYLLESVRQSPEHDRKISDSVRGSVLRRDKYRCVKCGWQHTDWNRSDARYLELHHQHEHVKGGSNTEDNLITVCTVCHDAVHRRKEKS